MAKRKKNTAKNRAAKKTTKNKVAAKPSNNKKSTGLDCLLLDIGGRKALLPKSTLNEVLAYQPPVPFENAPEWLLGSVDWKNWQVPVISFSNLSGVSTSSTKRGSHIAVIKSLADNREMPFIGIVIYAAPSKINIEEADITEDLDAAAALGVFSTVKAGKNSGILIPDLDRLNQLAAHAAYGALPITQIR